MLGLYGGDDARVNATDAAGRGGDEEAGKSYETHIYDGAGHGFLRDQEARDGANLKATRAGLAADGGVPEGAAQVTGRPRVRSS